MKTSLDAALQDLRYGVRILRRHAGFTFFAVLSAIAAGIATRYPDVKKDWGATVDRYVDRLVGPQTRRSVLVLMSAVAAVLLIGCANLANLLMARATLRSREIPLRLALGGRRGRVIRIRVFHAGVAGGAARSDVGPAAGVRGLDHGPAQVR